MIWLASFPRSGNTFFRNVLYQVYGIESSTYHQDDKRDLDDKFDDFSVVKTHLLPEQLPAHIRDAKSVYLIRDGRDALVSMAHHRKDIVDIGSDFYNNLLLAILSPEGSYFGGWSENVKQWKEKADIIIKFEDLIKNPIMEIEKLRSIMDLPPPDISKLPTFKQLKFGQPKYGDKGKHPLNKSFAKVNFRKGKSGGWKEEMPKELQKLFWRIHGNVLVENEYEQSSKYAQGTLPKSVLIDASKVFHPANDGIKRYLLELINHFSYFLKNNPDWEIDLYYNNGIKKIHPLTNSFLKAEFVDQVDFPLKVDTILLQLKAIVQKILPTQIYKPLSAMYRKGPFRQILNSIKDLIDVIRRRNRSVITQSNMNKYDLIHIPLPQGLPLFEHIEANFIVTVHDVTHRLFPFFHTKINIDNAEKGIALLMQKEAKVIAISNATKSDLMEHYSIQIENVKVIYEGAIGDFNREKKKDSIKAILKKYDLPATPFFLTLSTIEPRKNIANTIRAFIQLKAEQPKLNLALFVCGKKGWKFEEVIDMDEKQLKKHSIYLTGFISDEDLHLLFAHGKTLCYVSHYEGFGLPPLEAMQSGTPVIFGNNSSMPEVVGKGGLAVDSNSVADIQKAMNTMANNDEVHSELSKLAWQESTKFSWLKTAFETLNAYEEYILKARE